MKNIYCISGLGADERVFQKINIPGAKLVHLPWVPFHKQDELGCYAQKMASLIKEEGATVMGVSFGGMVAVEIAKLQPQNKTIIISSAKAKQELPRIRGFLKWVVRTRLIPFGLMKKPNKVFYRQFGAETDEEKQLLAAIMEDTDKKFLKWASKAILDWENETIPQNILHIHGTADRVIFPDRIKADHWIEGGSHFMIYNRAEEVSRIVAEYVI